MQLSRTWQKSTRASPIASARPNEGRQSVLAEKIDGLLDLVRLGRPPQRQPIGQHHAIPPARRARGEALEAAGEAPARASVQLAVDQEQGLGARRGGVAARGRAAAVGGVEGVRKTSGALRTIRVSMVRRFCVDASAGPPIAGRARR